MNRNVVDAVSVTIVADNLVDFLLSDLDNVSRYDLPMQFAHRQTPVQAEFGISFFVEIARAGRLTTVLFDAGLTGAVLLHNLTALGIDPGRLDHVAISHGHPDHYGGLESLVGSCRNPLPVATHVDAFEPRYAVMPSGAVAPFYNARFNRARLEDKGAAFVLSKTPVEIAPGTYTTGEIPRNTSFEGPRPPASYPGLYQVLEGICAYDQVMDEIGLVINVLDAGIVVLTGCGHAGVINSLNRAREITGVDRVLAVMGGFHLGFPGTPEENIALTVQALKDMEVEQIVPMHCTGLKASSSIARELSAAYVQPSVGSVFHFGDAGLATRS